MAKEIFISPSFEDHISRSLAWLHRDAAGEVLIVTSRPGGADDLARLAAAQGSGRLGVHRYTQLQLATELAVLEMARKGLSPLTGLGFEALCARVAHLCASRQELDYLQTVAETPGFVRSLSSTLRELRLQQISTGRLAETGPPGRDLSHLLTNFERELHERKLADSAVVYQLAAEAAGREHRFSQLPLLFVGLQPRTTLEVDFLAALARSTDLVLATVLEHDEVSVERLETALGGQVCLTRPDAGATESDTRLRRLHRFLFRLDSAEAPPDPSDHTVEFFSEPGQGREAVEIARRIRAAAEVGIQFDQVAILLRNPETYYPLVEDALRRAGIPGYFSRGTIRPDPAGRAFLALLECAAQDLSAHRFAEYLSLAQAPIPSPGGPPIDTSQFWVEPEDDEQLCFKSFVPLEPPSQDPIIPNLEIDPVIAGSLRTPAQWELLMVEASVIGGRDRWDRRLHGLAAETKLAMAALEPGSAEYHRLVEKLRRLEGLRKFALPLIERLSDLPGAARWQDWIAVLEELAVSALKDPHSVLALLAELRPMGEVGPVSLTEVERVLRDRLTLLRKERPPQRYGRVLIATPQEVQGRSFEWVFLPGLSEGLFPKKALEDPLLLDTFRRSLALESAVEQRRREERLLLRSAVAAARARLVVSYPRMDLQQGRSRVPSFYALDIIRAAEGRLPDVGKLEKRAALASSTRLGWPAPRAPQKAIDDSEYDLAVLEPLLKTDEAPLGSARFLLDANAHLARALRSRWQRWNQRGFTGADGLVELSGSAHDLVASQSLKLRSFSPTALQTFSACPYKFFLYALHRLQPREEAVAIEQLDPLTRGGLFHTVQFRLLTELRQRKELPIRASNEAQVAARAEAILREITSDYEDKLAPAIPRIWEAEIAQLGADLRGWIREQAQDRADWVPDRFEFSFGLPPGPGHDPHSQADPATILDGYLVRGSIDLLERSPSRDTYRVTDHKTGRPPQERSIVVKGGELLQPLLYSLAVENITGEPVEEGRLFYCTQRGDFRSLEVPVDSLNCSRLQTVLEIIDEAVTAGFLPAAPAEKACRFCDYRLICGPHEELRINRYKDPRRLARLVQLRGLP